LGGQFHRFFHTGHKKDSTFDKYLKIADEHKKVKLLEAWEDL